MKLKIINSIIFVSILAISAGALIASAETQPTPSISNQIREKIETKLEKNRDIRNIKVEERKELRASTTERIKELKEERKEIKGEIKNERDNLRASTTMMFKAIRDEKGELMKKMQLKSYEMRKNALISELNATFKNLTIVRSKISERITKLSNEGGDLTKAKENLAIADDKISKARIAIDAFIALPIPKPATGTASTTEVSLEKPRKTGDDAIKAVKDARDALKKTVESMTKPFINSTASSTNKTN